jgi:hypothetical protein
MFIDTNTNWDKNELFKKNLNLNFFYFI